VERKIDQRALKENGVVTVKMIYTLIGKNKHNEEFLLTRRAQRIG
jgi:hypothetical protein